MGYATEKILSPYNVGSIPVYWGNKDVAFKVFNHKAFIFCDLPEKLTSRLRHQYASFQKEACSNTTVCDEDVVEDYIYKLLFPYFQPCIEEIRRIDNDDELYLKMLNEPLSTLDTNGNPTGYWNESEYASAIRKTFDAFRYENGAKNLKKLLIKSKLLSDSKSQHHQLHNY